MLLSRIIHKDVKVTELPERFLHRLSAECFVPDVPGNGLASLPLFFDHALRLFRVLVLVEIHDCHVRSFFGKCDCGGAADAAISSRNQRHLIP